MKNMVKLQAMLRIAGIIALTAVIVFAMAACWLMEQEQEDKPADIVFPEALAGEDGIGWNKDGSWVDLDGGTGYYQTIVSFYNTRNSQNGYFYSRGSFYYSGGRLEGYSLKSVNGDSYTGGGYNSDTHSYEEVTFTAKVSGNKLTISDSSVSSLNGTYTKRLTEA